MKKRTYSQHECKFEQDIGYIKATVKALDKRINGSYEAFEHHVRSGAGWRSAIIAVGAAIILQVVSFAYVYGMLSKTVNYTEARLREHIENE